jgi:hypothetical protein
MSVSDCQEWVKRAQSFLERLPERFAGEIETNVSFAPPLDEAGMRSIESALGFALPRALRVFFRDGSGACNCRYVWKPNETARPVLQSLLGLDYLSGGPNLWEAEYLNENFACCQEYAEDWNDEGDEGNEKRLWLESLPFAYIENGDYLAVSLADGGDDPAVVYLAHDDASQVIAPSFTQFLAHWERLCYVGPESWLLNNFLDGNGFINADSEQASRLRALLGATEGP